MQTFPVEARQLVKSTHRKPDCIRENKNFLTKIQKVNIKKIIVSLIVALTKLVAVQSSIEKRRPPDRVKARIKENYHKNISTHRIAESDMR